MRPCNQCRRPVENCVKICEECTQWNASHLADPSAAPNAKLQVPPDIESEPYVDHSYAIFLSAFCLVITALFALIGLAVGGFDGFVVGGVTGLIAGAVLFSLLIKM